MYSQCPLYLKNDVKCVFTQYYAYLVYNNYCSTSKQSLLKNSVKCVFTQYFDYLIRDIYWSISKRYQLKNGECIIKRTKLEKYMGLFSNWISKLRSGFGKLKWISKLPKWLRLKNTKWLYINSEVDFLITKYKITIFTLKLFKVRFYTIFNIYIVWLL